MVWPNDIPSGSMVVAVVSGSLAGLWGWLRMGVFGWLLAIATPLVVAYALYWSPVWFGAEGSEFDSWAPRVIIPWTAVGEAGSLLMYFLVDRARNRKRPTLHFYDPASEKANPPPEQR